MKNKIKGGIDMAKVKKVNLCVLRETKGLSQKALAKELNISPGLVGMWETGKRTPSLKKATLVAQYFEIPLERISFSNNQK